MFYESAESRSPPQQRQCADVSYLPSSRPCRWSVFLPPRFGPARGCPVRKRNRHAEHDAELATEIGKVFAARPADLGKQLLTVAGVACVWADSDVGFFSRSIRKLPSTEWWWRSIVRASGSICATAPSSTFPTRPGAWRHGSFAGEHTVRVMRDLGYSEAQITELHSRRVINWEEVGRLPSAR